MFSKPIDRDIKGVIKVGQDDDANIKQELEEYVVTRELQKHFSDFFASYKIRFSRNEIYHFQRNQKSTHPSCQYFQ